MPRIYKVKQGDCFSSIASEHGFFWDTLWNHPGNARLKEHRKDPSVLREGDVVQIPDLREKNEGGATDERHRFRMKGVPAMLKIRLCIEDEPRADEPYTLFVDGLEVAQGRTDGDGFIRAPIPPGSRQGRLLVGIGDDRDVFVFRFGTVDPIDTEEGARGRLENLGHDVAELEEAVRAFQDQEGLDVTGTVDAATRERLKERFGQ